MNLYYLKSKENKNNGKNFEENRSISGKYSK